MKSSLSAFSQVSIDKTMFVEGKEFLHIDQAGWVDKELTSEEDNRMNKVQEILSEKYQKTSFSIYVKQLTTGKEAGINQDEKMYAASILKLPYLYYTQEKINEGLYQLDTTVNTYQQSMIFQVLINQREVAVSLKKRIIKSIL